MKIVLKDESIKKIEELLLDLPYKFAPQIEQVLTVLNECLVTEEVEEG